MTLRNNRTHLHCYFKLCTLFSSHRSIQPGVTVRKRPIRVKIGNFLSRVILTFEGSPWKTIGNLFQATSSCVHHFVAICWFKLELQSGNSKIGSKTAIFVVSPVTYKFDGLPKITIRHIFFTFCTDSFYSHLRIQTGVMVRKCPNWGKVVLASMTLNFDLWHWSFARSSLLSMVITSENFMIWWWEHSEKSVTEGRTDGETGGLNHS